MNEDNRGVALVLVGVLALVALGMWDQGRNDQVEAQATAMPAASATAEPSATVESGQGQALPLPAGVEVTGEEVVTYTYRLDERGERIWSEAGRIAAGRLIKAGGCVDNHRQVEYQPDLGRPGFWKVEWLACSPD
jgi:hypothetical protein